MSTRLRPGPGLEEVTGLEGYDPQLGEPVSDASDSSPTRRRWRTTRPTTRTTTTARSLPATDAPVAALSREPFDPVEDPGAGQAPRWWEFWKQ